jgi:S-formylglutathione hydrolase FrmB
MKGRLTAAGPMYPNLRLNHSFQQVCRRSAEWGVLLASVVLICACTAATPSTAPPPPTTAGTSAPSVAASSPSPATSAPPGPSIPARIVANKRLADREQDLTIQSPALGGQVKVRLLLPARYETEKARLWPVLYLLHGCCDSYLSWTRVPADLRLATGSSRDSPATHPWIAECPVAAVAGVSMGGLGALDYAARHPGMFTVAASFSGTLPGLPRRLRGMRRTGIR